MKNTLLVLATVVVIIVVLLTLRFVVGGPEDDWICRNGEWVKHGIPAQPKPTTGCGQRQALTGFTDCVAAGWTIMESYPQQCRDDQGNLFVEYIGNELEKLDLIQIETPRPNQTISSPLTISGQARGYWFFEGDFPIKLLDAEENIIAEAVADTKSEWMTKEFVYFEAELTFDLPVTSKGTLILTKDNPSGLPANDDQLLVPVNFNN